VSIWSARWTRPLLRRRRAHLYAAPSVGSSKEVLRGQQPVAVVARRHEENANLVFSWKRQYEKGLLGPTGTALVPVKVRKQSVISRSSRTADESVEIDLGAGTCMRLQLRPVRCDDQYDVMHCRR
jgi:transposase-like protein